MNIETAWLGQVSYQQGLNLQTLAWRRVRQDGISRILGLEHETVITVGKRGDVLIDLVDPMAVNCPVVCVDRGGQATIHSPGQLVIYPLLPVREIQMTVRKFVSLLNAATLKTLEAFGMGDMKATEQGVFSAKGKIGFVGIRIEKGISRHGISINVSNDLKLFSMIRSCGVTKASVSSMAEHGCEASPQLVFSQFLRAFSLELKAFKGPAIPFISSIDNSNLSIGGTDLNVP